MPRSTRLMHTWPTPMQPVDDVSAAAPPTTSLPGLAPATLRAKLQQRLGGSSSKGGSATTSNATSTTAAGASFPAGLLIPSACRTQHDPLRRRRRTHTHSLAVCAAMREGGAGHKGTARGGWRWRGRARHTAAALWGVFILPGCRRSRAPPPPWPAEPGPLCLFAGCFGLRVRVAWTHSSSLTRLVRARRLG